MLEDLYSKVDFTKKVKYQTGEEGRNTNISGNTDNVMICDNYCTEECTQPKLQENTSEDQQQAVSLSEGSRKRNLLGAAALFVGLLCLFLLTAAIVLFVLWILDKSNCNTERNQLWADNAKLTQNTRQLENENVVLKAVNLNLTKKIDELQKQIEPPCPANWTRLNQSCYFLFTSKKNLTDNQTFCEACGAHLVIISSIKEKMFAGTLNDSFLIGLIDQEKKGQWKWVNGQGATNMYWRANQMDNAVLKHCVDSQNRTE